MENENFKNRLLTVHYGLDNYLCEKHHLLRYENIFHDLVDNRIVELFADETITHPDIANTIKIIEHTHAATRSAHQIYSANKMYEEHELQNMMSNFLIDFKIGNYTVETYKQETIKSIFVESINNQYTYALVLHSYNKRFDRTLKHLFVSSCLLAKKE